MYPYRFGPDQPAPPVEPVTPVAPRRKRRTAGAALALMLAGSAVGGGAAGGVAATTWLQPQPVAAIAAPQAINDTAGPASGGARAVYASANPSVVQILAAGDGAAGLTPLGSGSGFVVDARGLILTNNHVIDTARAVSVRFSNGEERDAQVLGTDRGNDLALLKVDLPDDVPVARLGDSDQVMVGETAVAIGSPFGLDQTLTQGVISAVARNWQPGNGRMQRNLLQTDAPINPGNSGGPLLNDRGEVIGINTMIESPVRGSVGIGFAVPINTAKQLLTRLEAGVHLEPVWLGVSGREMDAELAREQQVSVTEGILVFAVTPGSPAAEAGLRAGLPVAGGEPRGGDIIVTVDGAPVATVAELTDRLSQRQPGDDVTLTLIRDGQEQQVTVTLQAWPEELA